MSTYIVTLVTTTSHVVIDARSAEHAMRRAVAVAKHGRENTDIRAISADKEVKS